MPQTAADPAQHTYQRKAAIATGRVADHTEKVEVKPIRDFDLGRTIFNTLEGAIPRLFITARIAKEVHWQPDAAQAVEEQYQKKRKEKTPPPIDPKLVSFMRDECNFNMEHADGSFLDHLFFCYEYTFYHYPRHSPLVMFLHSILGTATNTFAMPREKIPQLKAMLSDFEWRHVEAFPSVLRLLYTQELLKELNSKKEQLDRLRALRFYRVIDNHPIEMQADDFWIQLNYQLIHAADFLPVSNWSVHANDFAFILFRKLYTFLSETGHLEVELHYEPPPAFGWIKNEELTPAGWLLAFMPGFAIEYMTEQSVRRFSEKIGHSLSYEIFWN